MERSTKDLLISRLYCGTKQSNREEGKKKKKTSSFKSQRTGTTSPFKRILESCSLNGKNIGNEKADALTCSLLVLGED